MVSNYERLAGIADYKFKFGFPVDCLRIYEYCHEEVSSAVAAKFYYDGRFLFFKKLFLQKKHREKFIKLFTTRVKNSYKKIISVGREIFLLKKLRFIEGIFISGSVASLNAKENDDIDLFLIVKPKRLWLTRLLETFLLSRLGVRRRKGSIHNKDKLCMNFYKSSDFLGLDTQDLAFATQLVEAIPLYIRFPRLWNRLLLSNSWVAQFYPQWFQQNKDLKLNPDWLNLVLSKDNLGRGVNLWWWDLIAFIVNLIDGLPFLNILLDVGDWLSGILQIYLAQRKLVIMRQHVKQITTWYDKLSWK